MATLACKLILKIGKTAVRAKAQEILLGEMKDYRHCLILTSNIQLYFFLNMSLEKVGVL